MTLSQTIQDIRLEGFRQALTDPHERAGVTSSPTPRVSATPAAPRPPIAGAMGNRRGRRCEGGGRIGVRSQLRVSQNIA